MSLDAPDRRQFLLSAGAAAATLAAAPVGLAQDAPAAGAPAGPREFTIGIDGWSFHREVFTGAIKQVDLFKVCREEFGIGAFNLVNNMLEVTTADYVRKLGGAARKFEVDIPLIMIDSEGSLGAPVKETREKAVRDHRKWIWIASDLGCRAIRVNWAGAAAGVQNDPAKSAELIARSAESYAALTAFGKENGIAVLIENHWGPSSYPGLMVDLMKAVDDPNFGTLPDFGNFPEDVDRYDAVDRMMPYAKAVSAKCHDFDDATGDETKTDFARMMSIVCDKHGYKGVVGIEFEGDRSSEREGIKRCKALLERLRTRA